MDETPHYIFEGIQIPLPKSGKKAHDPHMIYQVSLKSWLGSGLEPHRSQKVWATLGHAKLAVLNLAPSAYYTRRRTNTKEEFFAVFEKYFSDFVYLRLADEHLFRLHYTDFPSIIKQIEEYYKIGERHARG